jgi:transcriptional regulator with XRE-family HTH domain
MHLIQLSILIVKLYDMSSVIDDHSEVTSLGRRGGTSFTERDFRERFATALSAAIGSDRGAQTRAAKKLGVPRQTVSLYLKGKTTPGGDLVQRAREIWGLNLDYGGIPIDADSHPHRPALRVEPQQLTLFSEDRQLEVHVVRKSVDSVDLRVSINFTGT